MAEMESGLNDSFERLDGENFEDLGEFGEGENLGSSMPTFRIPDTLNLEEEQNQGGFGLKLDSFECRNDSNV